VLGGSWSGPKDLKKDAEIYDPTVGKWSRLPGIQAAAILRSDPEDDIVGFPYRSDNYGMFYPWSNATGTFPDWHGDILIAASHPCVHTT
jgi:hypothetical protein